MAINLVPFDHSKSVTETNATRSSHNVKKSPASDKVTLSETEHDPAAERAAQKELTEQSKNKKRKKPKYSSTVTPDASDRADRVTTDSDCGVYTNKQDEEHHLIEQPFVEHHDIDIEV
ncbi:MAG: hypothetical protein V2I33_08165 [Kangiellaceae bacterium]|jgi:hypothetical protein|nr:hypothetical protein [Kangiellaceae bacterium]